MRLYSQDRLTEEMAMFLRILTSGVKQYVSPGRRVPTVLGTASLASTDLGPAGAERGHQIRKELRILAAAKDELGEQLSIIG